MTIPARLAAGGLAAAVGAGLLAPVNPAHALPATVPARIISSGCSKLLAYRESIGDGKYEGLYQSSKPHGAYGTVKYCTFKYRLKDGDPKGDYYLVEIQGDWSKTKSSDPFFGGRGGSWMAGFFSSVPARDQVFDATPTFKKTVIVGCPSLTAGFSFLGIGLDLSQSLCGSETVTRSLLDKSEVKWQNGTASAMKHVDLTYAQKVPEKSVPKYSVLALRPAYAYTWTTVPQIDHGYSYTGWKPTQTRTSLAWVTTR